MTNSIPDFLEILGILVEHKADFIVVGGVCAVLHGAPVTTFDLDLVHSRSADNLARLMSALKNYRVNSFLLLEVRICPPEAVEFAEKLPVKVGEWESGKVGGSHRLTVSPSHFLTFFPLRSPRLCGELGKLFGPQS